MSFMTSRVVMFLDFWSFIASMICFGVGTSSIFNLIGCCWMQLTSDYCITQTMEVMRPVICDGIFVGVQWVLGMVTGVVYYHQYLIKHLSLLTSIQIWDGQQGLSTNHSAQSVDLWLGELHVWFSSLTVDRSFLFLFTSNQSHSIPEQKP